LGHRAGGVRRGAGFRRVVDGDALSRSVVAAERHRGFFALRVRRPDLAAARCNVKNGALRLAAEEIMVTQETKPPPASVPMWARLAAAYVIAMLAGLFGVSIFLGDWERG